jgi:acyl dehydratase
LALVIPKMSEREGKQYFWGEMAKKAYLGHGGPLASPWWSADLADRQLIDQVSRLDAAFFSVAFLG